VTVTVKAEGATASTPWKALLVLNESGARKGWMLEAQPSDKSAPSGASASSEKPAVKKSGGFWGQLVAAFLGGLVLNLMPCVLPVIGLKIFGFVSQAGENKQRIFHLGLAFVGGVFVFFLGLAVAVISLRSAGGGLVWGFQFQNAYLLTALAALVLGFALSLLGVFEVTLAGGATNQLGALAQREGLGGAFFQGLFTTLLGTSCTAPFVGPVLGYAVTQPAPGVFALFTAMAAGLSLPYFLLTWQPAWLRILPRPGAWMERFKQAMGFIMLAVAVWLVTILATHSAAVVGQALWFLLVLAVACWLYGLWHNLAALAVAVALVLGGWFVFVQGKYEGGAVAPGVSVTHAGVTWEPFNDAALEAARATGRPVFVDFTAEWCINCKANEKLVLYTKAVGQAFLDKNVIALRADYTAKDPAIQKWLTKFERIGVPLYVLYRPGEPEAVVFPELLTRDGVLGELEKIRR
jgi:thiol:disulfide interchange protein DsbD